MKKISCVISAYYGNRRFTHSQFELNRLFYIQTNLKFLNKQTNDIHKIYIVCSFDDIRSTVEKNQPKINNRDSIMSELLKIANADDRIVLIERPNIGGSYHAWKLALDMDGGESDYIYLSEDDYTLYDTAALESMIEYWNDDTDLFFLCQYWSKVKFTSNGLDIPEHAAMAGGILNNRMYNQMKQEYNIDFSLVSDTNIWINQATFMENFRRLGAKFKDFRDKYSCIFAHDVNHIEEFGIADGKKLIMPIVDKFF
jgi:hypothetical protein